MNFSKLILFLLFFFSSLYAISQKNPGNINDINNRLKEMNCNSGEVFNSPSSIDAIISKINKPEGYIIYAIKDGETKEIKPNYPLPPRDAIEKVDLFYNHNRSIEKEALVLLHLKLKDE